MASWVVQFTDLSRLADEIFAGIQQRNRAVRAGSSNAANLQATLRKQMSELTLGIATLDDELYKESQNSSQNTLYVYRCCWPCLRTCSCVAMPTMLYTC
jgi:hypothetical protein